MLELLTKQKPFSLHILQNDALHVLRGLDQYFRLQPMTL